MELIFLCTLSRNGSALPFKLDVLLMFIDTLSRGGLTKIEYHHVKQNCGRSICFDLFFPTSIEVLPATDRNVPVKSKTVLEIKKTKSAPPHRRNKSLRVPQQYKGDYPENYPERPLGLGGRHLEWIGPLLCQMFNKA